MASVCLAFATSAAAAQDVPILSLDEAIELALAHNRTTRIAALEERRAEDERAALRTQRLPTFDLKVLAGGVLAPIEFAFRRGVFGTFPATGPIPFADITVDSPRQLGSAVLFSAVQPITQLGEIAIGDRLLRLGQAIAVEQSRAERQAVVANLRRAYYGLQQTRSGLEAVQAALAQLEELERVVADYVAREVALPADRLAVQTERARAEHNRLVLRNQEATLKEQINLLLGRDLAADFRVSALPEAVPVAADLPTAVGTAKRARPALREASLNVERAEQDLALKRRERIPDVSLAFNYLRLDNVDVLPENVAALSVVVSWNPFDWGRRQHEADARSRTLEQARLGLEEAEAMVEVDVRTKYRKLMEAQAGLRLAELAEETAAERLRVTTDRYRAEAALLKDVLEAQAALSGASQQYQQALGVFWTARADLEEALGDETP